MLKIKDNVDLKELKKYKIRKIKYTNAITGKTWFRYEKDEMVINEDRTIKEEIMPLDVIYDLIKDGLVEKVED